MRWSVMLLGLGFVVAGCAEVHEPPENAFKFAPSAGSEVIAFEEILVRATFRSGAALADLNNATCTLTRGARRLELSPPVKVSLPIERGVQAPLGLSCKAQIGPRLAQAKAGFAPERAEATDQTVRKRHYPESVRVVFEQ